MLDHIDMGNNDFRKDNLRMEHLKLEITRDINNSNLSIGNVYYILKTIFTDIENLYNQQVQAEYQEFCEKANENAAAAQGSKDPEDKMEEATPAAQIEEKEEN